VQGGSSGGPHCFDEQKNVITSNRRTKLNFNYIIKFVSINTSKHMNIFR
jgi:hypothetical protein